MRTTLVHFGFSMPVPVRRYYEREAYGVHLSLDIETTPRSPEEWDYIRDIDLVFDSGPVVRFVDVWSSDRCNLVLEGTNASQAMSCLRLYRQQHVSSIRTRCRERHEQRQLLRDMAFYP